MIKDKIERKGPRKTKLNTNSHKGVIENVKIRSDMKKSRIKDNLTQKKMAENIGMSYEDYKKYENGQFNLLTKKSVSLIKGLGYKIINRDGDVLLE